jgi:Mg-chelatase subunit ChlD
MNDRLTEIAFILDRSGSMASMVEPAIAGFNSFLREQQQGEGDARLTLVLFDNEYLVPCASLPVAEVVELDTTTYIPRGNTALLDAIGRTIDELGARLAAIPEAERPGQVVVAILTDGEENSSTRFTWQDIARKIGHQEKHYAWQFLFLGANQDAIATAARMGVAAANSATYFQDAAGYKTSAKAMSRKVSAFRLSKLNPSAVQEDLAKPMADILREEDEQERGR